MNFIKALPLDVFSHDFDRRIHQTVCSHDFPLLFQNGVCRVLHRKYSPLYDTIYHIVRSVICPPR